MGNIIDLTGQRFGKLVVIRRDEQKHNKKGAWWICQCDCGSPEKSVYGQCLRLGQTKSCGCLFNNTYDLSGEYGVGYDTKGRQFFFDLEDYDLIKSYHWYLNNDGYVVSNTCPELMHRLILHAPKDMLVDHKNHVVYDNRKENLRVCTVSENQRNRRKQSNNTSGVPGVTFTDNAWRVSIEVCGEKINLGRYKNKIDAVKVREEAEIKYFGEYRYQENDKIIN